jgi:hypothetical protein
MAGLRKYPVINGRKKFVKCGMAKPFTAEFYTRDATAPGGLTAKCKQCRYEQKRKWEIENPEKNRESQRNYYASTRDEYLPRKQAWRAENRDKDRESSKRWISKNKVRRVAYQRNGRLSPLMRSLCRFARGCGVVSSVGVPSIGTWKWYLDTPFTNSRLISNQLSKTECHGTTTSIRVGTLITFALFPLLSCSMKTDR